jgi:transcriptional regulator with XRE-family HTH domain
MVSLGALIKHYRMARRLSQFDVSTKIGWKDTSRLSKIEQGRVAKPSRPVVEKIMDALDLDEIERGEFLYAGDYVPTEEEIKKVEKEVQPFLDQWPYPAFLLDFTWRMISFNEKGAHLYDFDRKLISKIEKERLNQLELMFDPVLVKKLFLGGMEDTSWKEWVREKIGQFKIDNHTKADEKWFQQLMKKLMKIPNFSEIWNDVHSDTFKGIIHRFSKISVSPRESYYNFILPYFKDRRFDIVLYMPAK